MNLTTGTALRNGKYEIGAVVGQGCFQIAYRATHVSSKHPVQIETLNESWRQHPQFHLFQRRFVERVRQVAKCRHPHLVRVFDLFTENDVVYMVTETIGESTLTQPISNGKPLQLQVAFNWIRQVASALRVLHQQGVLHLNIKPDSIIQRPNSDRVVLANFSIVHHLTLGAIQTQAGMLSAGYAPPEQYDPQSQPTPATDVYALAATLYHLLTGQPPASAALRNRIPLVNLREIHPQLSPALEEAILQGLELSLERRSPSIEAWMGPVWREFSAITPDRRLAVASPPVQLSPTPEIDTAIVDAPSSPLPEVVATEIDRSSPVSTLPSQLQPWIPALFVATSAIAGIGGASFIFARQSNVATAPTPTFSRLQEAFPSRSRESPFGPDRAFVRAADPDSTSNLESEIYRSPEDANLEIDRADDSATMDIDTSTETPLEVEFPLEVESWQSGDRIPTMTVTEPSDSEYDRSAQENPAASDELHEQWQEEKYLQPPSPSIEDPQTESPRLKTILSSPPIDLPEDPYEKRVNPPVEAYFLPESPEEFSAPKQSKSRTGTSKPEASTDWSNTMPL
ncbi:MAG: protein kinase [Geitlerinemataceae cyanobacterium]